MKAVDPVTALQTAAAISKSSDGTPPEGTTTIINTDGRCHTFPGRVTGRFVYGDGDLYDSNWIDSFNSRITGSSGLNLFDSNSYRRAGAA